VLCTPAFGQTTTIFDNWNKGSVDSNPTDSTSFTISEPQMITYIDTYHWNYGQGTSSGGTITLRKDDGTEYGPWQVETKPGQGGVPNAWWIAYPNEVIPAGTYTIIDSEPETWSKNSESNDGGFSKVEGHPIPENTAQKNITETTSGKKLFLDGFEWTVVDDPSPSEPSQWVVQNGTLQQLSNIFRTEREYEFWQGTHVVAGSLDWTDYILSFNMTPADDDGVGALVRYQDKDNYYRFIMVQDSANRGPFRRLEKFADGQRIVLANDSQGYIPGQNYSIQFKALGSSLEVWMNGEKILAADDDAFRSGKVGFMDYASPSLTISNIMVPSIASTQSGAVKSADGVRIKVPAGAVPLGEDAVPEVADDVDRWIQDLNDTSPSVREAAAKALGELNDTRAVEPLILALKDEDSDVRGDAAMALGMLKDNGAIEPLILALSDEDSSVRAIAAESLGWALELYIQALKNEDDVVRMYAAESIGKLNDTRAVEPLIQALRDTNYGVRLRAAWSLGMLNDTRAIEPLIQALKDEDSIVQWRAAEALGKLNDNRAIEPLKSALNDEDVEVQDAAREALTKLGWQASDSSSGSSSIASTQSGTVKSADGVRIKLPTGAVPLGEDAIPAVVNDVDKMIQDLNDTSPSLRGAATETLGDIGDTSEVEPLIRSLKDEDSEVRRRSAESLGYLGDSRAVEPLIQALDDEASVVRSSAARALGYLAESLGYLNVTSAVEPLIQALKDEDLFVRREAAIALGDLKDSRAVEPLKSALNDEYKEVQDAAAAALTKLGWQGP